MPNTDPIAGGFTPNPVGNWQIDPNGVMTIVRPPIGLRPRHAWESQSRRDRIVEIIDAIDRYNAAQMSFPVAWHNELQSHINRLFNLPKQET